MNLNANSRLECLVDAGFAAAQKHPKGDRSAHFVVLFDFWLASVMKELDVIGPFWEELLDSSYIDDFKLGKDPMEEDKKPLRYIEYPKEVRLGDYGFHELVAYGLARSAILDGEKRRLLLEHLTAGRDHRIRQASRSGPSTEIHEAMHIAYRRFARSKGLNPDDYNTVAKAFSDEARRRFQKKEQNWLRSVQSE